MKYLAISYDEDQNQTFFDHVVAMNEEQAKEAISKIRLEAIPICAMQEDELRDMADTLQGMSEDAVQAEMADLQDALNLEDEEVLNGKD